MSEFPCYTFESLADITRTKLQVLYTEALRQRASKGLFLSQLMNQKDMDKKGQKGVSAMVEGYLRPYRVRVTDEEIEENWNSLKWG